MMKKEIDKGMIDIVNTLNKNGIETYYSCDGVFSHHIGYNPMPQIAYVTMAYNVKSLYILALALKEGFSILLKTDKCGIYYHNSLNENTAIIKSLINIGINMDIKDNEIIQYISNINCFIVNNPIKNSSISVQLNYSYIWNKDKRLRNKVTFKFNNKISRDEFYKYVLSKTDKCLLQSCNIHVYFEDKFEEILELINVASNKYYK